MPLAAWLWGGGGQPSWVSPPQLEILGFAPCSCRKGTDPLHRWGEPRGVPGAPRHPGKGGAGRSRALIPPASHSRAGGGGREGGNPPSSSAGKASLTRANENNQK